MSSEELPRIINISLDHMDEIQAELNNILNIKLKHNEYKKICYQKKVLNKPAPSLNKLLLYLDKIGVQGSEEIEFNNYDIKISEHNSENTSSICLDIINTITNQLIFTKELLLPKIISKDETINELDIEIDRTALITKIKNLLDKINELNNIENDPHTNNHLQHNMEYIETSTLNTLVGKYKTDYEILKNMYRSLILKRDKILELNADYIVNIENAYNRLDEYSKFLDYRSYLSYINILNKISDKTIIQADSEDYSDYFKVKQKLYSFFNHSSSTNERVEYFDVDIGAYKIGTITNNEQDLDYCEILPDFSNDVIQVKKINIREYNIDYGIHEKKRELYKELYKNDSININNILPIEDTINASIKFTLYDDIPSTQMKDKPSHIKNGSTIKKSLNILNNNSYMGIFQEDQIFNTNQNTILMFNPLSKPTKPGTGLAERLGDIDERDNIFDDLRNFSDWRIKLSNQNIKTLVFNTPQLTIRNVPFVVNNNSFVSIDHYYIYSIFNQRVDLPSHMQKKSQTIANTLLYNMNGVNANKSSKYIYKMYRESSIHKRKDWDDIKDSILKRGLYAKFIQIDDLQHILLNTKDALLIYPTTHVIDNQTKYLIDYNIMEVRYMLQNNIAPSPEEYNNYSLDIQKYKYSLETIKHELSTLKHSKDYKLKDVYLPKKLKSLPDTHVDEKQYDIQPNEDDYINHLKILEDTITQLDSRLLNVPFNVNCLYYSIVQGMYIKNIIPYNFRESPLSDLHKIDFKLTRSSDDNFQPFHVNAVIHMKVLLYEKLDKNTENWSTNRNLLQNMDNVKEAQYYLDSLNKVYSDTTIFNSEIICTEMILRISSALFNINFKVYSTLDSDVYNINNIESKEMFPFGEAYNSDKEPTTVILGNLNNIHYLNIVTQSEYQEIFHTWEKRVYYIIDSNNLKVASYLDEDEQLEIQGFFDNKTKTILSSTGNDELDNQIGTDVERYWENNSDDPAKNKDIHIENYWVNTTNGLVINENNGMKYIGELKQEEDSDGALYSYIEFN